MNKILQLLLLSFLSTISLYNQQVFPTASPTTIKLARNFSRDIFEENGVPYMQPLVESINATSNARFFSTAYVPTEVNKPYFKVSANGMIGLVRESQKFYAPQMPMEQMRLDSLSNYVSGYYDNTLKKYVITSIKDTSGLIYYAFKTLVYDGVHSNVDSTKITLPGKAPTILGSYFTQIIITHGVMQNLIKNNSIFSLLPKDLQDSIINVTTQFPEKVYLPQGANISVLAAGVPQIEIGSLMGTELIVRLIPPINMGVNIGNFAFWGLGFKHSLSQYFFNETISNPLEPWERPFDLAVQGVYQGTYLSNSIGYTKADLKTYGTILDFNIEFSKCIENWFDVFAGISAEYINLRSVYKYYLPVSYQVELGMLPSMYDPNYPNNSVVIPLPPTKELPGDTLPQTSTLYLKDFNLKFILGLARQFGNIRTYIDVDISKNNFNIITGGIEWRF